MMLFDADESQTGMKEHTALRYARPPNHRDRRGTSLNIILSGLEHHKRHLFRRTTVSRIPEAIKYKRNASHIQHCYCYQSIHHLIRKDTPFVHSCNFDSLRQQGILYMYNKANVNDLKGDMREMSELITYLGNASKSYNELWS